MKTQKNIIITIIALSVLSCSQRNYTTLKWQKQEYNNIEKIPLTDYLYDSKQKVFYLVTNDKENLFINLRSIDNSVKRKIINNGLTVWIDITAKNKKQIGVKYPLAKKDRSIQSSLLSYSNIKSESGLKNIENQLHEIELIGFDGKKSSSIVSSINENGFTGKLKFIENKEMIYQLVIPLIKVWNNQDAEQVLSIKMEAEAIGKNSRPNQNSGMRGGGHGSGQRGRGRKGGQMGGGKTNPGVRNQTNTPLKLIIKQLKLNKN